MSFSSGASKKKILEVLSDSLDEWEWVTTAGQLTFNFPQNVTYNPNNKWFQVTIGGIELADSLIQKDSPTQFTLAVNASDVPDGVKVVARWVK